MTHKKFLQVIGILFAIQLLDSTSSIYGMTPEERDLFWRTLPRHTMPDPTPILENENEQAAAMQNFEAVIICPYEGDPAIAQHDGRPVIVRNICEFRIGDYGNPISLERFSCQQCWEDRMDAGGRQLVRDNPPDDH